jgi:hypothetical protein
VSVSVDEQIARTVESALLFAGATDLFVDPEPSKRRAKAEAIATFACLCAPADPSPAGMLLAVRLLAIILYLDDLPRNRLSECGREMLEVLHAPNFSPTRPQALALQAYVRELDGYGDTSWFRKQFEQCLIAVRDEARLLFTGALTVASYKAIRPRLIFVEEYLWTWLLSERLPFDGSALERTVRLRQLASDVAYLVNDLGSVDRDRAPGGDPNLVFLIQREQGMSEERAIESVVRLHDETAAAYRAEANDVRGPGATPAMRAITDVVEFVVRGNLATTRKLSGVRYPGANERLGRLMDY